MCRWFPARGASNRGSMGARVTGFIGACLQRLVTAAPRGVESRWLGVGVEHVHDDVRRQGVPSGGLPLLSSTHVSRTQQAQRGVWIEDERTSVSVYCAAGMEAAGGGGEGKRWRWQRAP